MRISTCFREIKTLKILYCTFVRSILEYGSQIWNPRYDKYITRIESIQKRFIKYLCYRANITFRSAEYLQLCAKFHILPLSNRREISDVTYILKIIRNNVESPELLSKINLNTPVKSIWHHTPLSLTVVPTNYRQNSFLWRAGRTLNAKCTTLTYLTQAK